MPKHTDTAMSGEHGFTLLEVLLAIAVLAIALPALLGLRNFDLDLHDRATELRAATLLAQEKLLETELAGTYPFGETSGDFRNAPLGAPLTVPASDRASGYKWKRTIIPTQLPMIRELRIKVSWPRGISEESVEVSTIVFTNATS
jgi:general secretion pathway protein I